MKRKKKWNKYLNSTDFEKGILVKKKKKRTNARKQKGGYVSVPS